MAGQVPAYQFDFSGGNLALDFVNTLGDRPRCREEHLGAWPDLVAWGEQAGLLSKRERATLVKVGESRPQAIDRSFARALALRECLYRVFSAIAAGQTPAAPDIASLNAAFAEAMGHASIETRGKEFVWGWIAGEPSLTRLLWPVVRSAAELLVSPERIALRECASGTCSWLFVDRSPTKRRRWCSMKGCGNRDKVRRFYERQRRAEA